MTRFSINPAKLYAVVVFASICIWVVFFRGLPVSIFSILGLLYQAAICAIFGWSNWNRSTRWLGKNLAFAIAALVSGVIWFFPRHAVYVGRIQFFVAGLISVGAVAFKEGETPNPETRAWLDR